MNPHSERPISFFALITSLWTNKRLILQMSQREVLGRYKGSVIGIGWSLLNPIIMLIIYTFVFSVVFKARWGGGLEEGKIHFAIILFVGLIVHGIFAEVLNRSPSLILSNANYVKKIVFPLEILPVIALCSALFHCFVSILVLLCVYLLLNGFLCWTVLLLPLVFLPLIILIMGLSWILSSIGLFVRDMGQTIGIITTVMLFLSPVFYPISAIPESYRTVLLINPLTFIIEQAREIIIWGNLPNWRGLLVYTLVSSFVLWLGFMWFQKTRKGFADVI